jgi:hypothetical protein
MSIVDLEVLAKSGTPKNRKYAGTTFMLLSLQKKKNLFRPFKFCLDSEKIGVLSCGT